MTMIDTLLNTTIENLKQLTAIPKADFDKNVRAILENMITKMDLATHQELEVQRIALQQANEKIAQLHQRLDKLMDQLDTSD